MTHPFIVIITSTQPMENWQIATVYLLEAEITNISDKIHNLS